MLKILLISAHGAGDPGACSSYGIESNETRRVVNRLKQLLANYMTVTVYPQDRNCYADVVNGTVQVNMSAFDYVFEVHFNTFAKSLPTDGFSANTNVLLILSPYYLIDFFI